MSYFCFTRLWKRVRRVWSCPLVHKLAEFSSSTIRSEEHGWSSILMHWWGSFGGETLRLQVSSATWKRGSHLSSLSIVTEKPLVFFSSFWKPGLNKRFYGSFFCLAWVKGSCFSGHFWFPNCFFSFQHSVKDGKIVLSFVCFARVRSIHSVKWGGERRRRKGRRKKSLSLYWLRCCRFFGARGIALLIGFCQFSSGLLPGVPKKMHFDASFQRLWV